MRFNLFGTQHNQKSLVESGIGLIGQKDDFFNFSNTAKETDKEEQNENLQLHYENAYYKFPIVAASIDITAEQVVQEFYFDGPDKEAIEKWKDDVNFDQKLFTITKQLLRNGNIWVEVFDNKNGVENDLKLIDPKTMVVYRNKKGDVIGHGQIINDKKIALWGTTGDKELDAKFGSRERDVSKIIHFKYNAFAGEKYGTSLIHPVLKLLDVKFSIERDIPTIVQRYAAPIIHFSVGDAEHMPQDSDITNVQSNVRDIYSDTEFVTNYLVQSKVLGFEGKAMNLEGLMNRIDQNIISGLQVPPELLGVNIAASSKSESEVKLRSFGRHIKSIQRGLKIDIEDKIIVNTLGFSDENKIVFGYAEEREQEIFVDQIRGLVTDGIITPQKGNDLLDPKFREELPEDMKTRNPMMAQAMVSKNQDQTKNEKGADKIKDKPNDPTLKQKEPGQRRNKTDRAKTT